MVEKERLRNFILMAHSAASVTGKTSEREAIKKLSDAVEYLCQVLEELIKEEKPSNCKDDQDLDRLNP